MCWKEEDMEEAGRERGAGDGGTLDAEVFFRGPRMKYRILKNGIPGGA